MTYPPRNAVVTFRATQEMADALAQLGGDTENSRSNVVFLIVTAALHGSAPDMLRLLGRK